MRSILAVLFLLVPGLAAAESPSPPPRSAEAEDHVVALGVSSPLSWAHGIGFGASLAFRVSKNHAVRFNGAIYKPIEIGEASTHGTVNDLGAGWVWYPRRLWDGPTLELGALLRLRENGYYDANADPAMLDTTTTIFAGRALVGWSWLFAKRAFFAIAVGASAGYETGHERTADDLNEQMTEQRVHRKHLGAEGYFRIGFVFGG